MSAGDTALLVVDIQEKLIPKIEQHARLVKNVGPADRRGARILGLPVAATEQYPKGLGPTVAELARGWSSGRRRTPSVAPAVRKFLRSFAHAIFTRFCSAGSRPHVCVQQTALDLLADGWRVYVAVDAVGSRTMIDYETALRRMDSAGATLTTTEAALFEWCEVSGTPAFKQIIELVREID